MAILKILTFPNPVLRQKSLPVEVFDAELKTLAANMLDTMYEAPGVGLAANQVGALKRLLVVDHTYSVETIDGSDDGLLIYKNKSPEIYVNPVLLEKSGAAVYKEGCLSVPGVHEEVDRFAKIKIQYQDTSGNFHEEVLEGFKSIVLQHEMDHLEGKIFLDRLSAIKKSMIVGKLKKGTLKTSRKLRKQVEL